MHHSLHPAFGTQAILTLFLAFYLRLLRCIGLR